MLLSYDFYVIALPPKKITPPPFTHFPPKNSKSASPPFLPKLKIFQPPPCRKGGEDTVFNYLFERTKILF